MEVVQYGGKRRSAVANSRSRRRTEVDPRIVCEIVSSHRLCEKRVTSVGDDDERLPHGPGKRFEPNGMGDLLEVV